jgi:hypothetical protein
MRKNILLISLGIIVLVTLLKFVGYREVFATISKINPIYILLVICIRPVSLFLFSFKTYFLSQKIPKLKKISFWKYCLIQLSGMLVNNLTPGPSVGGEPLKAYYLEKATGMRGSACLGLYAMDSLVFMVTTFIFMSFSTFYLIFSIGIPKLKYFLAIWFLICLIVAMVIVFVIFRLSKQKKRFEKLLRWLYKFPPLKILRKNAKSADKFVRSVNSKQKAFMSMLKHLWKDKKVLWTIFLAGFIWYLLQGLGLWFLFKGLGFSVPFFRLVAVMTISLSVGYLVFVPGGTGATEGSAVLIMSLLGVPASAITAVILVDRFTFYILTYLFGYLAISFLSMIYTTPGKMIKNLGK